MAIWKEALQRAFENDINSLNVVQGAMKRIVFHNAATEISSGVIFEVGKYRTLLVDIDGNVTSATVAFKYKSENGVYKSLQGMRLSDWETGASTTISTTAAETWVFDITGLDSVIIDITEITVDEGESLTIRGKAVA